MKENVRLDTVITICFSCVTPSSTGPAVMKWPPSHRCDLWNHIDCTHENTQEMPTSETCFKKGWVIYVWKIKLSGSTTFVENNLKFPDSKQKEWGRNTEEASLLLRTAPRIQNFLSQLIQSRNISLSRQVFNNLNWALLCFQEQKYIPWDCFVL